MASDWLALGADLKRLRIERGLSIRRAANLVGVNFTRLREWENGVDAHTGRATRPSYDNLRRLARVYSVPADALLRLAGYGPEPELPEDERKLLVAYRLLPEQERQSCLAEVQHRAAQFRVGQEGLLAEAPRGSDEQRGERVDG